MWVEPVVLAGRWVRLAPLTLEHVAGLHRHYDPEVFRYLGRGAPEDDSLQAMTAYVERLNAQPNRLNFAVLLSGDEVAGRISYSEIRPEHRALEIGTMLMRPYWGSGANPESKLLLLEHAFERLGAVRVQFKVDARNARSQRAMEKLGAVREGVLRKYQTRPDGYVRDSVIYSVVNDEWPTVKSRLEARLGEQP